MVLLWAFSWILDDTLLQLHTDLQLVLGEHELSKAFTVPNALRKKSQTILISFQYRELPKLSCRHRKDESIRKVFFSLRWKFEKVKNMESQSG